MVHESAADGYRQESTTYAKARPSYHRAVIDRSVEVYGHGTIVDLGAGTGIFTRQLVERGLQPIAVEPVAETRAALQASLPAVTALDGTAEHTGLADSSVDTVFVAQAFHWFDHPRALAAQADTSSVSGTFETRPNPGSAASPTSSIDTPATLPATEPWNGVERSRRSPTSS